jgi:hypothetical protein
MYALAVKSTMLARICVFGPPAALLLLALTLNVDARTVTARRSALVPETTIAQLAPRVPRLPGSARTSVAVVLCC